MVLQGAFPALGFGAAPLGDAAADNASEDPDDAAAAVVDAAWLAGTRFFATAPCYGDGLSEIRLGRALARRPRDQYVLATTVGRIVDGKAAPAHGVRFDYTARGTLTSIEDSLTRLGVDRLDFVWVHDVAQDFHGDGWLAQFDIARTGAFVALTKLRDEGVIAGWGLAVNRTEPIELTLGLAGAEPDGSVLAGRYTLLDHRHALQRLMPSAAARGVGIVIAGPYNSGMLLSSDHHHRAPGDIAARVERIKWTAERHGVPVKAAALQFCMAHPATVAVVPGAGRTAHVAEDHAALDTAIPDDFWHELRRARLVSADAPLPIDG
jgi:D-threo-aldose 1-dehydrogenase